MGLGMSEQQRASQPLGDDSFVIGEQRFSSRLFVGTGKYKDVAETEAALAASGAEVVTVALRRGDLKDQSQGSMMGLLTAEDDGRPRYQLLPNTAGCYTVDDAVRTCRLARELGLSSMVKLEVIGDEKTLFPDNAQTLEAAHILIEEGFTVLPYCTDDPIVCKKLEEAAAYLSPHVGFELSSVGVLALAVGLASSIAGAAGWLRMRPVFFAYRFCRASSRPRGIHG